ncbi:molecular chaperone DnaK [Candidatus Bathyarchaeota archaeon]|jgi:molecular chaperone DnaK|nr:molecular chaperone DnaK [Candidatus Bathyarchaeota archaeon]MBT4423045.1 molecular chaperone DnaK [Candidatus Bathyarchaeota archaeon]MBT5642102.1 molecular chaperone DnaK [Candidatus Bathyarchaeota archaeon]MBT6603702.1 molecular chaperone DnaK [Candidatus Bathyarchaeota archaeon]MBT7188192.1 molecular chaperone DnaK [Candidatus Bathyarchaeota archaeon]
MSETKREKIIGIDLGTTNSAAAVMMGGNPAVIPSAEGPTVAGKMFPSVVAFTKDGQLLVGQSASRQAVTNPEGTIREAKRHMGTDRMITLHGKDYTPQQISSFILQKILRDTETYMGEKVTKAVITVPAHFNDNQRQATIDAGEIAGLSVTRIVNEPTAAALAYGLDKTDQDMKILVFSFGGGTNDTTIMDFGSGVFEVLSTSGDTQTGGADVDKAVMDYLIAEFKGKTGIDLTSDMKAMARLKEAAEKAKIELSNLITTEIELPYIAMNADGPQNLQITLTRAKLEQIAASIVERIIEPIRRTIRDSGLTVDKIDKLVLFGGMTKMPLVQKTVEELVGKKMERGIDPMECVAIGASIQGAVLAGEIDDIVLLDVTPLSLGVETMGAVMTKVLDRNTTIPTKQTKVFSTAADMQTAVTINVLQGERSMAADNINLGSFNLAGIPAAPRGVPQIEVTFDINADGVLNVSAKDLGTSKEMSITIQAATKLSDAEKDRMVREAEQYADADKEAKEAAEIKNQADTLVYSTEKLLNEQSEKIPAEMREKIMEPLEALKTAVQEGSTAEIKSKMEDLEKVAQELGASLYQQAGDQAAAGGPGGPQPGPQPEQQQDPGKKTVEADYKVVDEDEKE